MKHAIAPQIWTFAIHVLEHRFFGMYAVWRVQIAETLIEARGNDFPSAARNNGTVAHLHVGFEGQFPCDCNDFVARLFLHRMPLFLTRPTVHSTLNIASFCLFLRIFVSTDFAKPPIQSTRLL